MMCPDHRQCILPPHMIEAIKMRGGADLQKKMAALEKVSETIRVQREAATPNLAGMTTAAALALPVGVKPKPDRRVFDGGGTSALPGSPARFEGDLASGDKEVDQAFNGAGDVFKMYRDGFNRNSIDGQGMRIISTVHHRQGYNNAFWNGQQMVYGDGDGQIFKPLTGSLSVIGHELSHGVVQFSGGLIYQDQSGALNESFADVFGCLTVQYKKKQTAGEATWLIGDGLLGPGIQGKALRSMRAPGTAYNDPILGKDPQPYHNDHYVNTQSDRGGVHINSGIPNHAFYLFAQLLGGYAWEKAGVVWYRALQAINSPHATFVDWAQETLLAARTEFGNGSLEATLCQRSWKLVGIDA